MLIEDAARLAKIDQLYSLRLDHYVSLPVVSSLKCVHILHTNTYIACSRRRPVEW